MPDSDGSQHSPTLEEVLRRRRSRAVRTAAAIVVLIALAGAAWWVFLRPTPEPPAPTEPAPQQEPIARAEPEPEPPREPVAPREPAEPAPEPEPLPDLDASDAFVREVVGALSSRPELYTWMATDELIRRFVVAVDNVAAGRTPREHVPGLAPEEEFRVVGDPEQRLTIDPASFARYDTLTDVVVAIDSRGLVRAYGELEPLIDEAYRDLGYPDRSFDETLADAIRELLAAPVVVGEPAVTPSVVSYDYVDPELESLSAAQKQLLRFGPENAPRIQRKLREVARALGIPESELPLTPVHEVGGEDDA